MNLGITDCQVVLQNGQYVVFQGQRVHSMKLDGTRLAHYPEIKSSAGKSVFLPMNRLLIQGGSDASVHILSLEEGRTLASVKVPADCTNRAPQFALSADCKSAFDYWELAGKKFIVKYDLESFSYEAYLFQPSMRTMNSLFCADDGTLLILESMNGQARGVSRTMHQLTAVQLRSNRCEISGKYAWDAPLKFHAVATNEHYALNRDLKVYDMVEKKVLDLMQHSRHPFTQRNGFHGYVFYPDELYLLVYDGKQNDIISCKERKLIARYATPGDSYIGCLIDGEFWLGTVDGILKKPFPCFEDIPQAKHWGWPSRKIGEKFSR